MPTKPLVGDKNQGLCGWRCAGCLLSSFPLPPKKDPEKSNPTQIMVAKSLLPPSHTGRSPQAASKGGLDVCFICYLHPRLFENPYYVPGPGSGAETVMVSTFTASSVLKDPPPPPHAACAALMGTSQGRMRVQGRD